MLLVYCIDLQMAATFGKMLLEKNEQLQHELQHLQKVAEETMLENQVCTLYIYVCVMNKDMYINYYIILCYSYYHNSNSS